VRTLVLAIVHFWGASDSPLAPAFSQKIGVYSAIMACSHGLAAEWTHAEWEAVWIAMTDGDADFPLSPRPSMITWLHIRDVCEKAPNKRQARHRGLFHLLADEYPRHPPKLSLRALTWL
jgi:hypothetical protein